MKNTTLTLLALCMIALASCKGRHADATSNGETVEVAIPRADSAPMADSMQLAPDSISHTAL